LEKISDKVRGIAGQVNISIVFEGKLFEFASTRFSNKFWFW